MGPKFIALLLLLVCGHKVAFASGVHVKGLLNIDKSEVIACYLSSLKLRRFSPTTKETAKCLMIGL